MGWRLFAVCGTTNYITGLINSLYFGRLFCLCLWFSSSGLLININEANRRKKRRRKKRSSFLVSFGSEGRASVLREIPSWLRRFRFMVKMKMGKYSKWTNKLAVKALILNRCMSVPPKIFPTFIFCFLGDLFITFSFFFFFFLYEPSDEPSWLDLGHDANDSFFINCHASLW